MLNIIFITYCEIKLFISVSTDFKISGSQYAGIFPHSVNLTSF